MRPAVFRQRVTQLLHICGHGHAPADLFITIGVPQTQRPGMQGLAPEATHPLFQRLAGPGRQVQGAPVDRIAYQRQSTM